MKKIKLVSVLLAVIFVVTSAYRNQDVSSATFQQSFEFTGYDMMEPGDWTLVSGQEPTCNYASGQLCYIKTEKDPSAPHPAFESLILLSNNSSNFTQPYMGTYGRVRLKP